MEGAEGLRATAAHPRLSAYFTAAAEPRLGGRISKARYQYV